MRRLPAIIATALGLACGYGYTRHQNAAPSAAPAVAASADDAATARLQTDTPLRAPRGARPAPSTNLHPLLARAASLTAPSLPPPHRGWSAELDELRKRAELTPDAGATLPTPGFLRATMRGRSRLNTLDADVSAAAGIEDEGKRRAALATAQQRLLDECRGYVPEPPMVRYALGEIAARLGTDKDFWRFINDPPFAPGYSRDTEQAVDWARRAPAMVYERAVRGDAESAFVLGVSYAIDRPRDLDGGSDIRLLPAAIPNDPLQAYRWLSVYLRGNPGGDHATLARALMNRIGTDLSAQQRAEAERWMP